MTSGKVQKALAMQAAPFLCFEWILLFLPVDRHKLDRIKVAHQQIIRQIRSQHDVACAHLHQHADAIHQRARRSDQELDAKIFAKEVS